jgi:hypothetical protein
MSCNPERAASCSQGRKPLETVNELTRSPRGATSPLKAWASAIAVILLIITLTGCNGDSSGGAHLQGKVTLANKELPADASAHIMFVPVGKTAGSVTAPIAGSRYDCPNVPFGEVTVHFDITRAVGPMKRSERTGAAYQDVVNLVPSGRATGIPLQVTGDNANQNFKL